MVVFLSIVVDFVDSVTFLVPFFQNHFNDTSHMNMVVVTLGNIGPSIAVVTFFDALLIAPQAFFLHILVEIELQFFFFFFFSSFDLIFSLEISTARVEIQVMLLAVVHEAIDRFSTSVALSFAVFMASFGWGCEEIEGGIGEELVGSRCSNFHTVFVEIEIAFFATVSRAEAFLLAAVAGVWLYVTFEVKWMVVAFGMKHVCCHL